MKWKLVSVRSEIVLISTQARFTVCAERGIGSEVEADFVMFGDSVNLGTR